jgi:hypothetical protein
MPLDTTECSAYPSTPEACWNEDMLEFFSAMSSDLATSREARPYGMDPYDEGMDPYDEGMEDDPYPQDHDNEEWEDDDWYEEDWETEIWEEYMGSSPSPDSVPLEPEIEEVEEPQGTTTTLRLAGFTLTWTSSPPNPDSWFRRLGAMLKRLLYRPRAGMMLFLYLPGALYTMLLPAFTPTPGTWDLWWGVSASCLIVYVLSLVTYKSLECNPARLISLLGSATLTYGGVFVFTVKGLPSEGYILGLQGMLIGGFQLGILVAMWRLHFKLCWFVEMMQLPPTDSDTYYAP